jgi:phytoene dehydrogenase-like protein
MKAAYDVVILGAGHNGLVAAAYLAHAGLRVLVLEKNDYIGGATTSQRLFPDFDAQLSRYAYLVSLFPEKIIRDLGLRIELRRRATGSFTPYVREGRHSGLLISNVDEQQSRTSMRELTGSDREFDRMQRFYSLSRVFAEHTWDSMLQPLVSREEMQSRFTFDDVSREAWRSLAEEPIGRAIERYLENDLVRGLVLTDAKIGIFTHPHDDSLVQNCCFLYHLIGNKTGEWRVPVGGMGAVAGELERVARERGAEFLTNAELQRIHSDHAVEFLHNDEQHTVSAQFLLVTFGENVLARYTSTSHEPQPQDEGSVFKINMLLRRLPKLKSREHTAEQAFSGTFHTDEGYEQMNRSFTSASRGEMPAPPPGEVYCHTLTDSSILSPELRAQGYHTLTLFGLDMPWSLFRGDNESARAEAQRRFLASMNQWLDEPLEDCLAVARDGTPCIESKSPVDIEDSLGLYHGNIFQNAPTFPFTDDPEQVGTWGVETQWQNVFLCGSSAHRGGAVSGIPGHNAAMKVLESL